MAVGSLTLESSNLSGSATSIAGPGRPAIVVSAGLRRHITHSERPAHVTVDPVASRTYGRTGCAAWGWTLLRILRSDRLEPLVDALAERLRSEPLDDPMRLETVAVPSRGSERWLAQRLAERLDDAVVRGAATGSGGVCAGIEFPFPGTAIARVVAATEGDEPAAPSLWDEARLAWRVLEVLDDLTEQRLGPEHHDALAPLLAHLRSGDGTVEPTRRLPLARRIAATFDGYALLRPTMVTLWEQGIDASPEAEAAAVEAREGAHAGTPLLPPAHRWQPHLWRLLRTRLAAPSAAERIAAAARVLREHGADVEVPFPRLSVFGVSALPPAHLRVLAALAERIDVTVYLLCASPALWTTPLDELRNPLLSSLGRVGAGMAWSAAGLRDASPVGAEPEVTTLSPAGRDAGDEEPPATPTLLRQLQHDIVADAAPGTASRAKADGSVQVHGCHGPARQVEVLREVVTGLLADNPDVEPRDILVMTPDLDTFAPLVTAVFDDPPDDGGNDRAPQLPVRIADRRIDAHNAVAGTLLRVLELVDARVTVSQVLDVLTAEPVARCFGLHPDDLDTLARWFRETGVRWGIDAAHRDALAADAGVSSDASLGPEHTFSAGLDRLRLGVALHGDGDAITGDVLPYDDVEGDDVERLGRVSRALATLFAWVRALRTPRTPPEWRATLNAALASVAEVERDEAWQLTQVADVLADVVDEAAAPSGDARFPDAAPPQLTLAEIRGELARRLGRQPGAARYATGAITVCEPAPLRAVPHRVICLLGLDDGSFPRSPNAPGFDLVAADPQPADRDPRAEDRQLLLDAVLAAEDHLVVTYSSRDPRTNDPLPPSAPLGELLDAAASTAGWDPAEADALVTHHPLHPFDPAYFAAAGHEHAERGEAEPPPLPGSFDTGHLAAARAYTAAQEPAPRFVAAPLPDDDVDLDPLRLHALESFLRNPLRYLLRHRLGVAVRDDDTPVDDRDPFEIDGLTRWALLHERLRLDGDDARRRWEATVRRRGDLPAGSVGAHELGRLDEDATALLGKARGELGADPAPVLAGDPAEIDVTLDVRGVPARVVGEVSGLAGDQLLVVEASRYDARAELRGWVRLLALAASGHPVSRAIVVGRRSGRGTAEHGIFRLDGDTQATAATHLADLVALLVRGRHDALPLMPRTSRALVETLSEGLTAAWRAAEDAWSGERTAEGEDDAAVLALGPGTRVVDVFSEDVVDAARGVWEPLLAAKEA